MKQFFTLIVICAFSFLNAQIFSEDFSSGVPGGLIENTVNGNLSWTDCGGNTGGIPCTDAATFYHASASAYNTALDTPSLDLSSGVYLVSFTVAKREKDGRINQFFLEISNDGGSTWNTIAEYMDEIFNPVHYNYVLTPYSPSDNTVLRFRGRNQGGHAILLDNISINEVTGDDAALQSLDVANVLVAGDVQIKGQLINLGINPITSFDLNWQVNGGTVHTQNYNGQNIASGQQFNFTHADLWNATGGEHSLKVWVSNTNVTDVNPGNNEIVQDIMVASGVSLKIPLFEKFSSSTCPPCRPFNVNVFNPFYENYAHDKATYISYQVNWPGSGDPYYTAEVGTRRNYYSINAAPSILLNTEDLNASTVTQTILQQKLDDLRLNDRFSFFDIEADHVVNGDNLEVTIDITPYITAEYTVHAMVIEKMTTQNTGGNGETAFHHVFMKALPNANGTTVSFTMDEVETLNFSYDMSTTFVEEMDDLAVVVFIQDNVTKQIIQSRYTDASGIILGTNDLTTSNITLAPNPTSGLLKIISDKTLDVKVLDITGKSVYNQSKVTENTTLNLSGLAKGVYVVVMTDDKGAETVKKLIIK